MMSTSVGQCEPQWTKIADFEIRTSVIRVRIVFMFVKSGCSFKQA